MSYSNPLGKTSVQLEQELLEVYNSYPDWHFYFSFPHMVREIASNDVYFLHYVAKEYLKLSSM